MATEIELLQGRVTVDANELLERSRAHPSNVVILSGTLLEGFGNLYSDLDLYVISESLPATASDEPTQLVVREDGGLRRVNETLPAASDVLLDVQYYTFRELETLSRSLNSLYTEAREGTQIFRKTLHHEDEDLVHKLLSGRVLQDGTQGFQARAIFDPDAFCFLKYRNEVGGYAEFRDIVGSWSAGDFDTCLFNTRNYLISQVSGLMFLAGNTNPRPKWFVRRLASLATLHPQLPEAVVLWMHGARPGVFQKSEAIEAAFELIDTTYALARELLGANPKSFSAQEALELTEREFASRPALDRDVIAERRLRRRMFTANEMPLMAQLRSHLRVPANLEASCAVPA